GFIPATETVYAADARILGSRPAHFGGKPASRRACAKRRKTRHDHQSLVGCQTARAEEDGLIAFHAFHHETCPLNASETQRQRVVHVTSQTERFSLAHRCCPWLGGNAAWSRTLCESGLSCVDKRGRVAN